MILVGDILYVQQARKRPYVDKHHTKVVKKLLKIAKNKEVIYVLGNHDWDIASILPYTNSFAGIRMCKSFNYKTKEQQEVMCMHGHQFDNIPGHLAVIGDFLYNIGLRSNSFANKVRAMLGMPYFSYSKWCKDKAKGMIAKTLNVQEKQLNLCEDKGYDVLVTGHTHMPHITKVSDTLLVNTGAFVEIATYVIEEDGVFKLNEVSYED